MALLTDLGFWVGSRKLLHDFQQASEAIRKFLTEADFNLYPPAGKSPQVGRSIMKLLLHKRKGGIH